MTSGISLKLVGLDNVTRRITKVLPDEVEKGLAAGVRDSAVDVQTALSSLMPRKTGATASQLKIRTADKGLTAKIGVFGDRGYIARFLNFGVKAHAILARQAKALSIGGRYAKRVMHPGFAGKDFLGKTLALRQGMQKRFGKVLRDAVARAANK